MKLTEFYQEKQGRPESKVALDMDKRGPSIPYGYISGVMLQSTYSEVNITNNYYTTDKTIILADASSGIITVNLPLASDNTGRYYIIKKVDSSGNGVVILPVSGELLDGVSSLTITLQYGYIMLCCSGVKLGDSHWHVIGGSNVKMEEIISKTAYEQIDLLEQLLDELRQNRLHLASMSDEPIESGDGDDS